jgi:hypothetical protein
VLCQLDVISRAKEDPAALSALAKVVSYALTRPPTDPPAPGFKLDFRPVSEAEVCDEAKAGKLGPVGQENEAFGGARMLLLRYPGDSLTWTVPLAAPGKYIIRVRARTDPKDGGGQYYGAYKLRVNGVDMPLVRDGDPTRTQKAPTWETWLGWLKTPEPLTLAAENKITLTAGADWSFVDKAELVWVP